MLPIPGQHAIVAQGCGSETASIPALHETQGHFQVRLAGEPGGDIPAYDEIVNVLQEALSKPGYNSSRSAITGMPAARAQPAATVAASVS